MRETSALRIVGWLSLISGLLVVFLAAGTGAGMAIVPAFGFLLGTLVVWGVLLTLASIAENLKSLRATARRIEERLEKPGTPVEERALEMPGSW